MCMYIVAVYSRHCVFMAHTIAITFVKKPPSRWFALGSSLLVMLVVIFLSCQAMAGGTSGGSANPVGGYTVAAGTTKVINRFSVCSTVTNNNSGALYVPTTYAAEWTGAASPGLPGGNGFLNHPPTNVVIGACNSCTKTFLPTGAASSCSYTTTPSIPIYECWPSTYAATATPSSYAATPITSTYAATASTTYAATIAASQVACNYTNAGGCSFATACPVFESAVWTGATWWCFFCPNGYSLSGVNCNQYSCNAGDTLSGSTCTTTSPSYSCNAGDTLSGTTCTTITGYSCPSGGTLSGTTCDVTTYSCPSGGTLSGTTCDTTTCGNILTATNYACPAGYVSTGPGGVCVEKFVQRPLRQLIITRCRHFTTILP